MKKLIAAILLCSFVLGSGIMRITEGTSRKQPQVNTVGLIAHYKMWDGLMTTGEIFDYTCNGHGGSLQDGDDPITLVPAYPGFHFDGTDDYILIADHADFTPILTPFSISAWINVNNSVDFGIAIKGIQGIDAEWAFALGNDEKLTWYLYKQSTSKHILTKYNTALTAYNNTWIYIVATYDGGTLASGLRLYLNSARVDDAPNESGGFTGVEAGGYNPRLGFVGPVDYADGLIDDVMFFNKELTTIEVRNIYEVTRWRYGR